MINSPTPNTQLTFEQMQQIAEVEARLNNIQNEIMIATKELKAKYLENDRIKKEKDYITEQLDNIKKDFEKAVSDLEMVRNQVIEHAETNKKLTDENAKQAALHQERNNELTIREKALAAAEQLHARSVENFNKKEQELSVEKEKVQHAKETIAKALEAVVW